MHILHIDLQHSCSAGEQQYLPLENLADISAGVKRVCLSEKAARQDSVAFRVSNPKQTVFVLAMLQTRSV